MQIDKIKKLNELTEALQDQAVDIHNAMAGIIEELEKYKVELEKIINGINSEKDR